MKSAYILIILILGIGLVMFSSSSMMGAARGFELFIINVFPALFPFFVCTCTLRKLGAFSATRNNPFGALIKIFLLSCVSGSPTGPLLIDTSFGESSSMLSVNERSILAAICNLSSPIFIIGTVCTNMLERPQLSYLIAISHYGTSALMLIVSTFLMRHHFTIVKKYEPSCVKRLSSILPESIAEASETMLRLCGTLVFFSTIIGLFTDFKPLLKMTAEARGMLFGVLEMTNGIGIIASSTLQLRIMLSFICALLSFGGLCIFMQASSLTHISPIAYLSVKICHACISGLCCYLLFPILTIDAFTVHEPLNGTLFVTNCITIAELALCGIFASCIASLLSIIISGKTRIR